MEIFKSFYKNSKNWVSVRRGEAELFNVQVGLKQDCVMSLWLFIVHMDETIKGLKGRVMGSDVSVN